MLVALSLESFGLSDDCQSVHLYKEASVSGITLHKSRLRCVMSVLDSIARHGFSLARSLELGAQWNAVVIAGPSWSTM